MLPMYFRLISMIRTVLAHKKYEILLAKGIDEIIVAVTLLASE